LFRKLPRKESKETQSKARVVSYALSLQQTAFLTQLRKESDSLGSESSVAVENTLKFY